MKIVVYGDYVCPFCFLEIPALERVAGEKHLEVDYRPYELRPDPVPTLDPKGHYLETVWEHSVYPMAERLGVPIKLPPLQPRSRLAFEGLEYARRHGRAGPYNRAVYQAFFQEGQDIGKPEVLSDIAEKTGLDKSDFRNALNMHRHLPEVLEKEQEGVELGVDAVPLTIIGERAISGCVPYEALAMAADRARNTG